MLITHEYFSTKTYVVGTHLNHLAVSSYPLTEILSLINGYMYRKREVAFIRHPTITIAFHWDVEQQYNLPFNSYYSAPLDMLMPLLVHYFLYYCIFHLQMVITKCKTPCAGTDKSNFFPLAHWASRIFFTCPAEKLACPAI